MEDFVKICIFLVLVKGWLLLWFLQKSMFTDLYSDKFPKRKIVNKVFNAHKSLGDMSR